ncbi:hypothetical protein [Nocardioides zeae]
MEVSTGPDRAGADFAAELPVTRNADGTSARCTVPGRVTYSRVHDLVGITLPGACLPDEAWSAPFAVGADMVLVRRATVGARTVSSSDRQVYDTANDVR